MARFIRKEAHRLWRSKIRTGIIRKEGVFKHDHQGEVWRYSRRQLQVGVVMGGEENPRQTASDFMRFTKRTQIQRWTSILYSWLLLNREKSNSEPAELNMGSQNRQSRNDSGILPDSFFPWVKMSFSLFLIRGNCTQPGCLQELSF